MSQLYNSLAHSKWDCKYHVVFTPKMRKKQIYGQIRKRLREIFHSLATQKDCKIVQGYLMPGHVHMLIEIPPKYKVSEVVGFLKGKSAIAIAREFSGKQRNFTGEHFWARGYVTQGPVQRIEDATAITYVMHYTLVPNSAFGTPTITTRVHVPSYTQDGPSDYCDGGVRQKTFIYNGHNQQTLTCVKNKLPPYVPGTGPPPPLPSAMSLRLSVYAQANGEHIHGGTSGDSPIDYVLEP